jgi:hypothetical protein
MRLGRFWDPPAIDPAHARIYGADAFSHVLAQKLRLELVSPPDDLLLRLPATLTKRAIARATIAKVAQFPAFVKSVVPKLIRSRVYGSRDELVAEATGLEPETELMVSEIVELVAEARSWVLDGEVLTIACYEGDSPLDDARTLAAAAAALVPSPCVLDVGLTPDRGWIVIEANAAWGAGLNGCDPAAAAKCIARASHARMR